MVKKGQTILEFVIMLLALTAIGAMLSWIWPSLNAVQTNAGTTIGRD
jgi:hypothetical protein